MNNSISNKNLELVSLDWNAIQIQMKNKLGIEIYESWLKKLILQMNLTIIFY